MRFGDVKRNFPLPGQYHFRFKKKFGEAFGACGFLLLNIFVFVCVKLEAPPGDVAFFTHSLLYVVRRWRVRVVCCRGGAKGWVTVKPVGEPPQ